jgi:putative flippase GtrA
MTLVAPRFVTSIRHRLRTPLGKRFGRFVLVAAASVAASQIALPIFLGPAHLTGGISGVAAGMVGAIVSYVLSRWAWERKGRPNVLRETLPFWLVSVGAWLILGLSTKLGIHVAASMHLHGVRRQAVVNGVYLAGNCVTFLARFVIFHYVLFADRGSSPAAVGVPPEAASPTAAWDDLPADDPSSGDDEVAGRGARR